MPAYPIAGSVAGCLDGLSIEEYCTNPTQEFIESRRYPATAASASIASAWIVSGVGTPVCASQPCST